MQVLARVGGGALSASPLRVPALGHPGGPAGPFPGLPPLPRLPPSNRPVAPLHTLSPSTPACPQFLLCHTQRPKLPPAGCRDQQPCFPFTLQTRVPESHRVQPHLLLSSRECHGVPHPILLGAPSVSTLPGSMFSLESTSSLETPPPQPGLRRALPRTFPAWKCHLTPFGLLIS